MHLYYYLEYLECIKLSTLTLGDPLSLFEVNL